MKTPVILAKLSLLILICTGAGTLATVLTGCATEESHVIQVPQVAAASAPFHGVRSRVAVGKFDNRSSYMQGLFSDGVDRLGSQAKTILIGDLQQTGRFNVLDRGNMDEIKQEANLAGEKQAIQGAYFVITGDVTTFGRKEVGDKQLFGILGRGKQQIAYAKVTLNVVDVKTSEVLYSANGAGEYTLSNREVIGFGGTASYDSTLNGKVLELAIREAVDHLTQAYDTAAWGGQR